MKAGAPAASAPGLDPGTAEARLTTASHFADPLH
jgi:hypothetical protein